MIVTLLNQSQIRMPRRFLGPWIRNCLRLLSKENSFLRQFKPRSELTIVFVDPKVSARLNKTYRQKSSATDVLSFSGTSPSFLGEIVICPEIIRSQARKLNISFERLCGYVALHGILHLLGYEHEASKRQREQMFALQDELFEFLCNKFRAGKNKRHLF